MNKTESKATCVKCGMTGLVWNRSVKGKWYLGVPMQHTFEDGNTITTHIAAHNCKPTAEGLALYEAAQQERKAKNDAEQARIETIKAERLMRRHFDAQLDETIQFSGVVETVVDIDGYYGAQRLVIVNTANHEIAKMITTAKWAYDLESGDDVTISGIVSGFDYYNEVTRMKATNNEQGDPNIVPQTIIKKPKLVKGN